jgi:hypothetical protein
MTVTYKTVDAEGVVVADGPLPMTFAYTLPRIPGNGVSLVDVSKLAQAMLRLLLPIDGGSFTEFLLTDLALGLTGGVSNHSESGPV